MSQNHFMENSLKTIMLAIIAVILMGYVPFKIGTYESRTVITEIGRSRLLGPIFIFFGIIGYLYSPDHIDASLSESSVFIARYHQSTIITAAGNTGVR